MALLEKLRKPVDDFLDKTLINAEDQAIRINRLNLLSYIRLSLNEIADFSVIEG
jgi:glycyl-tRNA synthetase beta chain